MSELMGNALQAVRGSRKPGVLAALAHDRRGQMTVELAVVFPVALIVVYIMINIMMYLGACARFDALAAESIRTMAASPGSDSYDIGLRAGRAQSVLAANFRANDNVKVQVSGADISIGGIAESMESDLQSAIAFSLLPKQERYTCTLIYHPWGFPNGIFGVQLFEVRHQVEFVIDPYRPGIFY